MTDAEFISMMRIRYGWAAKPTATEAEIKRLIIIATSKFQDPPPPLPNHEFATGSTPPEITP